MSKTNQLTFVAASLSLMTIAAGCQPNRNLDEIYGPGVGNNSIVTSIGSLDAEPEGQELKFFLKCKGSGELQEAPGEVKKVGSEKFVVFAGEKIKEMKDGDTCHLEALGEDTNKLKFDDKLITKGDKTYRRYYLTTKGVLKDKKLDLMVVSRFSIKDLSPLLYEIEGQLRWQDRPEEGNVISYQLDCAQIDAEGKISSKKLKADRTSSDLAVFKVQESFFLEGISEAKCTKFEALTSEGIGYDSDIGPELKKEPRAKITIVPVLKQVQVESGSEGGSISVGLSDPSLLVGAWESGCISSNGTMRIIYILTQNSEDRLNFEITARSVEFASKERCEENNNRENTKDVKGSLKLEESASDKVMFSAKIGDKDRWLRLGFKVAENGSVSKLLADATLSAGFKVDMLFPQNKEELNADNIIQVELTKVIQ